MEIYEFESNGMRQSVRGSKRYAVTFRPNQFAGEKKVVLRGSRFVELKSIER